MKNLILASSSSIHGSGYLEYLEPELKNLFQGVSEIVFIPYARPSGLSYKDYTTIAANGFSKLGIKVKGLHEFANPVNAIENAQGIFVGGGNTFVLVAKLQELDLMYPLKKSIDRGVPYLGTSAGSNICGITMQTTNDMPIMMPQSFDTLKVIPFNINAHFIEADANSTHKGETRETRIKEYHIYNDTSVIGLQEGSWLEVSDSKIMLRGLLKAFLFQKERETILIQPQMSF